MRAILLAVLAALLVAGAVLVLRRARPLPRVGEPAPTASDRAELARASAELRTMALRVSAEEAGIRLQPGESAYGVVMDIGFAEGVATVLALRDGSASIYYSSGGGELGGGGHESVRRAAIAFVRAAEPLALTFQPAADFPLPAPGRVRFTVLTATGRRTVEQDEAALVRGSGALPSLYAAGQEVITRMRLVSEARQRS